MWFRDGVATLSCCFPYEYMTVSLWLHVGVNGTSLRVFLQSLRAFRLTWALSLRAARIQDGPLGNLLGAFSVAFHYYLYFYIYFSFTAATTTYSYLLLVLLLLLLHSGAPRVPKLP